MRFSYSRRTPEAPTDKRLWCSGKLMRFWKWLILPCCCSRKKLWTHVFRHLFQAFVALHSVEQKSHSLFLFSEKYVPSCRSPTSGKARDRGRQRVWVRLVGEWWQPLSLSAVVLPHRAESWFTHLLSTLLLWLVYFEQTGDIDESAELHLKDVNPTGCTPAKNLTPSGPLATLLTVWTLCRSFACVYFVINTLWLKTRVVVLLLFSNFWAI